MVSDKPRTTRGELHLLLSLPPYLQARLNISLYPHLSFSSRPYFPLPPSLPPSLPPYLQARSDICLSPRHLYCSSPCLPTLHHRDTLSPSLPLFLPPSLPPSQVRYLPIPSSVLLLTPVSPQPASEGGQPERKRQRGRGCPRARRRRAICGREGRMEAGK